jgi:hypothetical protein
MLYTDSLLNEVMSQGCSGTGFVVCFCGGDLCVCGLDGQECMGCHECSRVVDEDWSQDWQEPWERADD